MRIATVIVFISICIVGGFCQAPVYNTDVLFGKTRKEMAKLIPQLNESFEAKNFQGFRKICLYFNGKGKFDQVEIYFVKPIPEKEALRKILAVFPLKLKNTNTNKR